MQGFRQRPVDAKILEEYASNPVNLSALYDSGDPFVGKPSSAEAVDGPGYREPAIEYGAPLPVEPPPMPDRYNKIPPEFRP